jgi:hypothetical protein
MSMLICFSPLWKEQCSCLSNRLQAFFLYSHSFQLQYIFHRPNGDWLQYSLFGVRVLGSVLAREHCRFVLWSTGFEVLFRVAVNFFVFFRIYYKLSKVGSVVSGWCLGNGTHGLTQLFWESLSESKIQDLITTLRTVQVSSIFFCYFLLFFRDWAGHLFPVRFVMIMSDFISRALGTRMEFKLLIGFASSTVGEASLGRGWWKQGLR